MNYDYLSAAYWQKQSERIETLRQKIQARGQVGNGLVVPDDSLVIGQGKRLKMAIMFIDICDFSKRPMDSLVDQDFTLRVMNLFFTEMIRIAQDYGGQVEKNTGDGLLVYFADVDGDPPEVGAIRALTAALTMQAANEHIINKILASNATSLAFRVSIDYGYVTVANVGVARGFTSQVAIGTTANCASKIMKHAGPGEIVIGEDAKLALPVDWQRDYTQLLPVSSGFVYSQGGTTIPYGVYKYTGRWNGTR